jgi:hypothetical protein
VKPESREPTLAAWLATNGLSRASCAALLRGDEPGAAPAAKPAVTGLDPEQAWAVVVAALAAALPAGREAVARAASGTRLILDGTGRLPRRAMALRDAGDGRPAVVFRPDGTARDLIVLAHEFGHAMNYREAGLLDPPPILREACALLCETLVLSGLPQPLAVAAAPLHDRRRARHLGPGRHSLLTALEQPEAPYDYDWNYPPARRVADALLARGEADEIATLFGGAYRLDSLGA